MAPGGLTEDRSVATADGGELLLRSLAARGVRHVFSVSGGPINPIYHATTRVPVELVHVRHEGAAGFMADATARTTRIPGVAVVTLGPGVTNTVTPAGTALRGGVPMLIVGAQTPMSELDREAGMALDTVPIMTPVTKWAARVLSADRIEEYVDEAWRRMLAGRPGPVYLEIPADVLGARASAPPPAPASPVAAPGLSADAETRLAEALAGARRPLLIAGDDVFFEEAGPELRTAVEHHGIPFAQLRLARGAVDERHELYVGPAYCAANPVLRRALGSADVVLLVGHTWEFDLGFGASIAADATVVQSHPDSSLLGRQRRADVALTSGSQAVLEAVARLAPADVEDGWAGELAAAWRAERQRHAAAMAGDGPMHPLRLVEEVVAAAPADTVFVTSHGNVDFWADAHLQVSRPAGYLRAGQLGTLGTEIPYGVGAKLADPDRPVIVIVGDGGFGYHCLELETAARAGAPIVVVVADDERWGAIALPQRAAYGVEVAMALPRRDWAGLAVALGGHGEVADEPSAVGPAVRRALESGRPAVVHARIASVLSPYIDEMS